MTARPLERRARRRGHAPTRDEAADYCRDRGAVTVLIVGRVPPSLVEAIGAARVFVSSAQSAEAAMRLLSREHFDVVAAYLCSRAELARLRSWAPRARQVLIVTQPQSERLTVDACLLWPASHADVAQCILPE